MKPNCIDISTWQENVDFEKVKAAGISAVIIRGGFAETRDNQFENHYRGAKAAGLHIGAYWYSYAYSAADAEREAQACIGVLRGKSFDLPVYYDMEEDGQMALGKPTMTAMACRFLDTVKAAGYRVGVYSSPSWFTSVLDYDALKAKYSIWLAHWASAHSRACDIWQYGYGTVSGVSGDCDCNIIENWDVVDGGDVPAGVTAEQAMKMARSLVGKDENPAECDIMAWYGGFDTDINEEACCCAGMMYLFHKLGALDLIPGGKTANCGTLALNFYNAGQLHRPSEVRPGDLVIFSWSGDTTSVYPLNTLGYKTFDHVEICLEVGDSTIVSCGANNGGYECDDFQIKTRRRSDISACCRPNYADSDGDGGDIPYGEPDVKEVQSWLNATFGEDLDVDGVCGSLTRAALTRALQTILNRDYGADLEVDGVFGKCTRKAIVNLSRGDKGDYVRVLQGYLIGLGYDTGGFDGDFGHMTESSVLTFQTVRGLVVDGIAGKCTFEELARG